MNLVPGSAGHGERRSNGEANHEAVQRCGFQHGRIGGCSSNNYFCIRRLWADGLRLRFCRCSAEGRYGGRPLRKTARARELSNDIPVPWNLGSCQGPGPGLGRDARPLRITRHHRCLSQGRAFPGWRGTCERGLSRRYRADDDRHGQPCRQSEGLVRDGEGPQRPPWHE